MRYLSYILLLCVVAINAIAQVRVHPVSNVHPGPGIHRPWAGSDTYDKNIRAGRGGGGDSVRSNFQRDRDATLDVYHREEERARSIEHYESARAEKMQQVRDNKAIIEANQRAQAAERRAREAEQLAIIRQRAEEQQRVIKERQAEQEKTYDAILHALPPCAARLPDGSPCPRKANPGSHFCYMHVDCKLDNK